MLIFILLWMFSPGLQGQSNQKLSAWGSGDKGQLGNGSSSPKKLPGQVTKTNDWFKLSAGYSHGLGIKNDGSLWAWGYNRSGQLGDGTIHRKVAPVQIGSADVWQMVSAGYSHSLGIKSDGTLWAWGNNDFYQLGDGTTVNKTSPVQIGTDADWAMVTAGNKHSHAIKKDGSLWGWGNNQYGQLGNNSTAAKTSPVRIGNANNWQMIAAGDFYSAGITSDGALWAWGDNRNGQLGLGTTSRVSFPVMVGTEKDWLVITAGENHSLGIKSDGTLWAWGGNERGQLGDGTTTQKTAPVRVGEEASWITIEAGYRHSHAIKNGGSLWGWGNNYYGQLGDGTSTQRTTPVQIGAESNWNLISGGYEFSLGIKSDGSFWSWGDNESGRLGDGVLVPGVVGTDINWEVFSAGRSHNLGIKNDGTLWAWGYNGSFQLGDGTSIQKNEPVQIGFETDWESVAAGGYHSAGIKSDGTLWIWGQGGFEDGPGHWNQIPVKVTNSSGWKGIAAGNEHSLGIQSDGTLWAWGYNFYGQLGDGTTEQKITPVQIGANKDWLMVSAGEYHSLALKNDGTIWVWGFNNTGELGSAGSNNYFPVQLGTDADWAMVEAGARHSYGLKNDGTLWAWGQNGFNQFGNGKQSWSSLPVQIGSDNDWLMVSSGYFHGFGLKTNGAVWGWGFNYYGQLGDGTTEDKSTPVQIGTATNWNLIKSGEYHTLGLSGYFPSNEDLISLTVSPGSFLPAFSSETTVYTGTVENAVASVTLLPVLANDNGSVEVNGVVVPSGNETDPIILNVGSNLINVKLTAMDAVTTKVYKFIITRENAEPVLDPISEKNVNEKENLSFIPSAKESDAGQTLTYSLIDAPEGATIEASTGLFSWTPAEEQGPGSFTFKVKVTDNGSPALSDEAQMTVTVNEINTAPVLAAISDYSYAVGSNISFKAVATDADFPSNMLTYSLEGTVPAGAAIDATTGAFTWTPGSEHIGSHEFKIRVADNGSPVLFHEQTFALTVESEQGPAGPDIIVLEASYGPDQLQYQKLEGTVTLKNIGSEPISSFNVTNIYFSKDEIWDADDVYGGFVNFTNLEVGQTVTRSIAGGANQFGIDAGSEYGYLVVRADYRQEVAEADENNNNWSGRINIRNASVDLAINSFPNNSSDMLSHGEMLNVNLSLKNNGTDNVHNAMYEYFLSPDEILDETDARIGYLNWIGFYWNSSATENDLLAIPNTIPPAYYHVIVRINTQGQQININDYNPENNVVSLFRIYVTKALNDNILNFNQPFGTRSWEEDGHQWSWDNSGWDNIRDYQPYSGSGHAMSAAGYSSRLSTTSLMDISGLWVKTSGSSGFTHLRILGYDKNDALLFTQDLNPGLYEMGYAYVDLNWEKVMSIRFDYDAITQWDQPEVFYDDLVYVFLEDNTVPSLTCPANKEICSGSELPDYRSIVSASDDSGEFSLSQFPAPGSILTETTTVTITAEDGASNKNSCSFTVTAIVSEECQPSAPSRPNLASSGDTGLSNSDGITKNNTPELYGVAVANSLVSVYVNGEKKASTTAGPDGNWSYTILSENALADGNYQVKVSATGISGIESPGSEALEIIIDNQKPVVSTKNIIVFLDETGNASITARDADNGSTDNITAAENFILSLNRSDFACGDAGKSFEVILEVVDEAGNAATNASTVTVGDNTGPVTGADQIFSIDENSPNATAAGSVTATDNCSLQNWSIMAGNTSDAFVIDGSGVLRVKNSAALDYESTPEFMLTISVEDPSGNFSSENITIQLKDLNEGPVLAEITEMTVNELELISFTVSATDVDNAADKLQFSMRNAPEGAVIDAATGRFSWIPTEEQGPQVYAFSVSVTDGELSATETVNITVNEVSQAPVVTSQPLTVAKVGEEYFYKLEAQDGDLPVNTFTYDGVEIPAWLNFDPSTQVLSGMPDESLEAESYKVQLQVRDGTEAAVQEFTIQLERPTGFFDKEQNNSDVFIYPNPTSGRIMIEWGGQVLGEGVEVSLLDLGGRVLFQYQGNLIQGAKEASTYLQEIKAGVYLIQLKAKDQLKSVKLIKK